MSTNYVDAKELSKKTKNEYQDLEREMYYVLSDICDDTSEYFEDATITQTSDSSFNISISQDVNSQSSDDVTRVSTMGKVHLALDVLGFIPCLGAIPDIANGIIYLCQGDYPQMALSFVAAIPGYGDTIAAFSKGAKFVGETTKITSATAKRLLNTEIETYAASAVKAAKRNHIKKISVVWTNGTKYNAKSFVKKVKQIDPSIEVKSLESNVLGIQMEKIVNRKLVDEYVRDGLKKAINKAKDDGIKLTRDDMNTFRKVLKSEAFDLLKDDQLYSKVIIQGGKRELGDSIHEIQELTSKIFVGGGTSRYSSLLIKDSLFFKNFGVKSSVKQRYINAVDKYVKENPNGIISDYKIRFKQFGRGLGKISKEEEKIHGSVHKTIELKSEEVLQKIRLDSGSTVLHTIESFNKSF